MPENHGGKTRSLRRQKSGLRANVDIFLSSILTWCILELRLESLMYDKKFYLGGGAEVVDGWGGGGNSERGLKWGGGG